MYSQEEYIHFSWREWFSSPRPLFLFFFFFFETGFLSVALALLDLRLELRDLPIFVSLVLELKMCATTPRESDFYFLDLCN